MRVSGISSFFLLVAVGAKQLMNTFQLSTLGAGPSVCFLRYKIFYPLCPDYF